VGVDGSTTQPSCTVKHLVLYREWITPKEDPSGLEQARNKEQEQQQENKTN
jgi:hypothetical protein